MEKLSKLKDCHFIEIAKIIDNNFIGNPKIVVDHMKMGVVRVTGTAEGKQCINCDVKIDIHMNKLNGVYIENDDINIDFDYRHVTNTTLKKVINYLQSNNFEV